MPLTTGSAVFAGGAGATSAVCAEVALAEPATLVPVTTTRIVEPTSAGTAVYVDAVAPAMSAHEAPELSHRRHW
ncbi:MAG TPA: hypothetical protein VMT10_11110 [Solirubrobacteraceae bacterium]|nr:hypothetical protein [Solirubrobacteraceae bacterium]